MAGCSLGRFWREYLGNGPYALHSLPSQLFAMGSALLHMPAVWAERDQYDEAIRAHALTAPPVFIIGHWRSGTTYLHNLLSVDPRFAFMSFLQSAMPLECLGDTRLASALLRSVLPETRGMDNVEIGPDLPQEEEMALGILSGLSAYKGFYFPRNLLHHYRQAVLLEEITDEQRAAFRNAYEYLVRKISYAHDGKKQILFKNPASTTRIPLLLDLFPDARFVHIIRDPHEVYASMQKLWQRLVPGFSWQKYDDLDFTEPTLEIYENVMRRYLHDRELVPAGHLVEVRYENLDLSPVETIASIYQGLDLPHRDEAMERLRSYLGEAQPYQKNKHSENLEFRRRIAERWSFAFDAWGYDR
jgi:hypothetical protein